MSATIIACLISAILGAAGMGIYDHNQPPKTVIQNITTTQNVETKTTSVQTSDQGQYTVIFNGIGTNKYCNVNLNARTNISFVYSVKTNRKSTTNSGGKK